MNLPRNGGLSTWAGNELRGTNFGYFAKGNGKNSPNFGGNLEILPPDGVHKLGRIVLGDSGGASERLQQFLSSQEVQSPVFNVPVDWLAVAHIDEITSFLSGGTVAIADPAMARNLMTNVPAPQRGRSVFFATGAQPVEGVATSNSTANMRIETGVDHTGQTWRYIRVYDGAEAGTVGVIDTLGNGFITVSKVWKTTSKIINGAYPDYDIYHWTEWPYPYGFGGGEAPRMATWQPAAGSKYVLCEGTKFWNTGTPAIVTAAEVLADDSFRKLNVIQAQSWLEIARTNLQSVSAGLIFKKVPNLFFGELNARNVIVQHRSVAFNPGPTNMQPLNNKLYMPRQFCFRNAAGEDVFEEAIKAALGGAVEFVDCWDLYHALMGEVHCGSNDKRAPPGVNWWENQP